jgi:glycosyltransferase involved in cell wall biosynthesis
LSRPERFTVPSIFLKERLVHGEGLPASRTDVLPWPVEPLIDATGPVARNGGPPTRLLFVGSLIPEKGPDVLIEAFRRAFAERSDLRLTIVGAGPRGYVDGLHDAARGLPVQFTGRLERPGVVDAYSSHDVLVFPSVWAEPFSLVPLEAMAMGLTVIATRTGGTPEAVAPGQTGLLVPRWDAAALADAILRVAGDSSLARALARGGETWARENRGFDGFLGRLEALYEDCRDGGSRAAR